MRNTYPLGGSYYPKTLGCSITPKLWGNMDHPAVVKWTTKRSADTAVNLTELL